MKKNVFSIDYLTPDTRKVTFPSGRDLIAKHVFELKDYVVLGEDDIFYVFKKDHFAVLMSIKLKGRYFDEAYDRKQNSITFNYHGSSYSATLDLDAMTLETNKKEDSETRVKISKCTEDDFFCVFADVSKKSFYLQFGVAGHSYPHFLQVRNFVIFGGGKTYSIRNLETKEKYSLLVEDNAYITQIKQGVQDTGTIVFVKKNGDESIFDLISKKVLSGEKVVRTL